MSMRILFLGKRRYTNQDALVQRFGRIYRLPLSWHRAGHPVLLTLLDYHGYRREYAAIDGFVAHSVPFFSPRSLSRLTSIAKEFQPDIIIGSGDCFVGLVGHRLARRIGAKFAFDVYDDYRTLAAYRAFINWDAFGFLCGRADLVIYASRVMADKHDWNTPNVVVPNGVDDTEFEPVPMREARAKLGLSAAGRLVGYFGSMTAEHGVNVLISALEKLRSRQSDVQLLLCGRQNPATPATGDGVIYHGMVPHDRMPAYLNACDVLALPYLHGAYLDHASSCKIAEYLFCRRPIVATRTPNFVQNFPEQARQLEDLLATPGDPDALAICMQRQFDNPLIAEPPTWLTWQQIADGLIPHFERLLSDGTC